MALHFARDGDAWRYVEHFERPMLRGGGYEVDGQRFDRLTGALRQATELAEAQVMPEAERRAWIAGIEAKCTDARAGAWDGLPQLDLDPICL